jgi:acyl dehydratase
MVRGADSASQASESSSQKIDHGNGRVRERYLDDFRIGEVFVSRSQTLGEKHFSAFAQMTGDLHPIHYDAGYARSKGWEAPLAAWVASAWHLRDRRSTGR